MGAVLAEVLVELLAPEVWGVVLRSDFSFVVTLAVFLGAIGEREFRGTATAHHFHESLPLYPLHDLDT